MMVVLQLKTKQTGQSINDRFDDKHIVFSDLDGTFKDFRFKKIHEKRMCNFQQKNGVAYYKKIISRF